MGRANVIRLIARATVLVPGLVALSHTANAQPFQWAAVYSEASPTMRGIAVGPDGSIYATGFFYHDMDMDPGPGEAMFTSYGFEDAFLTKFTPDGAWEWTKQVGGPSRDGSWDVAVDAQGNVFWGGWFSGTADMDAGANVLSMTAAGTNDFSDAFVVKLSSAGELIWCRAATGVHQSFVRKLAVDHHGDVWVVGDFNAETDFDPSPSTYVLDSPGSGRPFLWKLTADGDFAYAGMYTSGGYSTVDAPVFDTDNNVYISQSFTFTLDGDPGPAVQNLSAEGVYANTLLTKLAPNGELLWNRHVYAEGYLKAIAPTGMVIDLDGNIVVRCSFDGPVDMDPGPGELNLVPVNGIDQCLWMLSSDGSVLSAEHTAGGHNLDLDPSGRFVASGEFQEEYDADPGPGAVIFTPASWRTDFFITAMDPSGAHIWSGAIGADMDDVAFDQDIDADGNIIIMGYVQSEVDMDPGAGSAMFQCMTPIGDYSWFVLKLGALSTSVDEPLQPQGTVLPTVVDNILVITTDHTGSTAVVRDLRGATVASKRLTTQRTELDLSHLPTGPYLIDVLSDEGRTATRIIKL